MTVMNGLIFGNGFSGNAGRALKEYVQGYAEGFGVYRVGGMLEVDGPGHVIRSFFRKKVVLLFSPFLLWFFLLLTSWFGPGREVCVTAIFGLRSTCEIVRRESQYSLSTAFRHFYWVIFFGLFEGNESVFAPTVGPLLTVGFSGLFIGAWIPIVGQYIVVSCIVLMCWVRVKKMYPLFRWLVLFFFLVDFGIFVVTFEVFFPCYDGKFDPLVSAEEEVDYFVPHVFFSLEVPVGSCRMTEIYFVDRVVGEGMTESERVMSLKGDRFLKLLAARYVACSGGTVSTATAYEAAQTDDVFRGWNLFRGIESESGKKTRASYPEVMWGEIFDLWVEGRLEFLRVWEAFLVFQQEALVVAKSLPRDE